MNYRSVVRFAAVTTMTAAAAFSADWQIEETKIPFAFRAGVTQMPAGSYRVDPRKRTHSSDFLPVQP